jgi:hypothetical protein
MFKRMLFATALTGLLVTTAALAAPSLELGPNGGALSGGPGEVVGWGFQLTNDENFLVVTSATFDAGPTWGSFEDTISADNFFVVGPTRNGSTVWAQKFDLGARTGIGRFTIDDTAEPGHTVFGDIVLTYDLFSRSPLDAGFNPDLDTLSTGQVLTAYASVTSVAEPSTWACMLAGMLLLARTQGSARFGRAHARRS